MKERPMQNVKTVHLLRLLIVGICVFSGSVYSETADNLQEQEQIIALLAAVRQAQQPAHNMRVSWEFETVEPFVILDEHAPSIDTLTRTTREYTIFVEVR